MSFPSNLSAIFDKSDNSSFYYEIQKRFRWANVGQIKFEIYIFVAVQDLALIDEAYCVRQIDRIIKKMSKVVLIR